MRPVSAWMVPLLLSSIALAGCLDVGVDDAPLLLVISLQLSDDGFTVQASGSFNDGVTPDTIHWDWGDGTSIMGHPDATHTYARNGTYEVTARADHAAAGRLTTNQTLTIGTVDGGDQDPPPGDGDGGSDDGDDGSSDPPDGGQPFDGEPDDCSKLVPPGPFDTQVQNAVLGYETRTLDIILLVDESFKEVHGDAWPDVVDFIAEQADAVYQRELDLVVSVSAVYEVPRSYMDYEDTNRPGLVEEESQAVLDASRQYMDDVHPDDPRDLVYALIGSELAGTIAGQAECIGGAGYKDAAYGWGEAYDVEDDPSWAGTPIGIRSTALKVILHEMAHILGAHHHYANCVEHVPDYDRTDGFGTCGMMFNDVGLVGFQFSTLNKMAIRGWAEEVDL